VLQDEGLDCCSAYGASSKNNPPKPVVLWNSRKSPKAMTSQKKRGFGKASCPAMDRSVILPWRFGTRAKLELHSATCLPLPGVERARYFTCGICPAKPASKIRKRSAISCVANCCDERICWLPPSSRGSARAVTFVLPEDLWRSR